MLSRPRKWEREGSEEEIVKVEKDAMQSQRRILAKFLEVRFHNHLDTEWLGPPLRLFEPPLRQNLPLLLNLRPDSSLTWTKQSDRS